MASSETGRVEIDGRVLRVTNVDKVLYPATGTTKGEVIAYFQRIAPWFVPHARRRPVTRKRWPNGVGDDEAPGQSFFEKNLRDAGVPDWVATGTIEHSSGPNTYPLVDDAATLAWLGQLASLEVHVPQWRFSDEPGDDGELVRLNPDRLVLDLDPGPGSTRGQLVELAHLLREVLTGAGLVAVPVTSGSKGIHLYAGLDGSQTSEEASAMARELARQLERMRPDLVVSDMKKSLREGKILLDWSQNNGNKTTVAPWSLRGRTRPTVAAPRDWDELTEDFEQLEFTDALARLEEGTDPLAGLLPSAPTGPDRLHTYRSMRDATRTPEPVPAEAPQPGEGSTFVIQRHQARRLHYDLRLEHEGVLASWAVPKGPPTDREQNHLAVQTEDHPLSYAQFEGRIPKGEYGAGVMTIWDHGTYEREKWVDGKEVIVTLHGQPDGGLGGGPRRYALLATRLGGEKQNWLIHLMDDEAGAATTTQEAQAPAPVVELGDKRATQPSAGLEALPDAEPMLATAASLSEVQDGEWVCEIKWDGYRAVAKVADGQHRLTSRGGIDLTPQYPELAELAELIGERSAVIDGEVVVLDDEGRSRFELLQQHAQNPGSAHYMAFDLLHVDGRSLLNLPWTERRAELEALLAGRGRRVHVPETLGHDVDEALEVTRILGLEGVVCKRTTSTYRRGTRARTWLKLKHVRTQKAVVVGWSPGKNSRNSTLGSVLLGMHEGDRLVYIGRAGSGFSDEGLRQTRELLSELERDTPAVEDVPGPDARDAHWVEPLLACEVGFTEWSQGGKLRHPVWRRWRPDVHAEDVVREG